MAAGGAGESPPEPKGRAAFCLDDDSDEAELALVPSELPHKKARKNAAKELRTISCRGMELTVKARDKIRGIAVPLEGPTLMAILKHLRERMTTGEIPEPDAAKSALRKEALANREDEDAGRLCWRSGESAYQIMWQDADGKTRRRTRGLQVARKDTLGKLLSAADFRGRRLQMLGRARALWNELDKTAAERYDDLDVMA